MIIYIYNIYVNNILTLKIINNDVINLLAPIGTTMK